MEATFLRNVVLCRPLCRRLQTALQTALISGFLKRMWRCACCNMRPGLLSAWSCLVMINVVCCLNTAAEQHPLGSKLRQDTPLCCLVAMVLVPAGCPAARLNAAVGARRRASAACLKPSATSQAAACRWSGFSALAAPFVTGHQTASSLAPADAPAKFVQFMSSWPHPNTRNRLDPAT